MAFPLNVSFLKLASFFLFENWEAQAQSPISAASLADLHQACPFPGLELWGVPVPSEAEALQGPRSSGEGAQLSPDLCVLLSVPRIILL